MVNGCAAFQPICGMCAPNSTRGLYRAQGPAKVQRRGCARPRLAPFEHDHGDLTRRSLLVLGEARHQLLLLRPDALPLGTGRDARAYGDRLGPELDLDIGIGLDVVKPGGVRRRAALRREYRPRVFIERLGRKRIHPFDAAFRSAVMKQDHRVTFERPADSTFVGPELVDDGLVVIRHVSANAGAPAPHSGWQRLPSLDISAYRKKALRAPILLP